MSELHDRLSDFCENLGADGFCPHGIAIIVPTSAEDADLLQEYGNNLPRLRALIAREDPEHVLQLRAKLLEVSTELGAANALNHALREDCDRLAQEIDVHREKLATAERHIDRLVADLNAADRETAAEHSRKVHYCDELVATRERAEDAERNYAEACESVGILAGELHRMGGALRTAEAQAERYRLKAL